MYREDSDSFNGSLGAGGTVSGASGYLEIETKRADYVHVWVDDTTTGGSAASYDLFLDAHKQAGHFTTDWMRDYQATGSTAFKHQVKATGDKFRLDLTNQSGASANYRIFIESFVEDV